MSEAEPVADPLWQLDNVQASSASHRQMPTATKAALAAVCAGLLVAGFLTARSYERVEGPVIPPTPVPTPSLDLDSFSDPAVQARFEVTLATLPELTLVLQRFDGNPAVRVQAGSAPRVESDAFSDLHSLEVDVSGEWVAGLSGIADTGSATVWVGPVDGELAPLADGVGGFAWHQTDPAALAFSSADRVFVFDPSRDSDPEPTISTPHHLDLWGRWGYVVRPRLNGAAFHVLSPQGEPVATDYQGSVVGSFNHRLIVNFAGGQRSPRFVFADTGQAWPVFALTDMNHAHDVATGGRDGTVAMLVSNRDTESHEIRVFPGTGLPMRTISVAEQSGALTWSADGSTLYFLSRGVDATAELFSYDFDSASLMATPVGASAAVNYWESSIALGMS